MKIKILLLLTLSTAFAAFANPPATITVVNESGPDDAPVTYWALSSYAITSAGLTTQDESYDINTTADSNWYQPGGTGTINTETLSSDQYFGGASITGVHDVLNISYNSGPPSYRWHTVSFPVQPDFTAGNSGQAGTVYITTGTNSIIDDCRTNISFTFQNSDSITHCFIILKNGVYAGGPFRIAGGTSDSAELYVACSEINQYSTTDTGECNSIGNDLGTNQLVNMNTNAGTIVLTPDTNNPADYVTNPITNGGTNFAGNTPTPIIYNATNMPSPIIWSNLANTNSAVATMNGDSAIYNAITKNGLQAHNDIATISSQLDALSSNIGTNKTTSTLTNYNLETTQQGISNLLANMGTNGGMSLTQFQGTAMTVQSDLSSNGFDMNKTNGASVLALNSITSAFGRPSLDESGDAGEVTMLDIPLDLANKVHLTLGTSEIDEWLPALHGGLAIFRWAVIMLLIIANYKVLVKAVKTTMLVPQATTSGETLLGTNINAASAIIMAGAIVAVVASLPTVFASGVLDNIGKIAIGNPLQGAESGIGKAYGFACHYFPIGTFITALLNHFGFRIAIDSAETVCMGIIKFLTGL